MLPVQFCSLRSVSIQFSNSGTLAPSVRCPSNFPGDSCSGVCGIATTFGEIPGLRIGLVRLVDIAPFFDTADWVEKQAAINDVVLMEALGRPSAQAGADDRSLV